MNKRTHIVTGSQGMNIGITGTDGKTSTLSFTVQLLEHCGKPCNAIGTFGEYVDGEWWAMPDLGFDREHFMRHVSTYPEDHPFIFEAYSPALANGLYDQLPIQIATFTTFSREHLLFHKTEAQYLQAKLILFNKVMKRGIAIINATIPEFQTIADCCLRNHHKIITYGASQSHIKINATETDSDYVSLELSIFGKIYSTKTQLQFGFLQQNLLCAIGLVHSAGIPLQDIVDAVPYIHGVPGRAEYVTSVNGAKVFVDYAHTPHAMQTMLQSLRTLKTNKLWIVFGCGGGHYLDKAPALGRMAHLFADYAIVTDDNPRRDDPAELRHRILQACPDAIEIPNRKDAIAYALARLQPGDCLVVTGKGHETTQIVGTKRILFNDRDVILEWLNLNSRMSSKCDV
jgi:UDP-N-acetylmuramoyl-L-alanyl-D-glutamate--2,6-diaminopimelate ligase